MDPIQMVLTRLEQAGRSHLVMGDDSLMAQCPAHGDACPSLSIKRDSDGRALLYCHAGCSFAAILEALGLRPSDLFAGPQVVAAKPKPARSRGREYSSAEAAEAAAQPRGSKLVTSWQYRSNDGREAFRVIRFEGPGGKTYRPIHKQIGGLWRVGDPEGLLPLYRLPELLADQDAIVWVAEGEKVADALVRCDLIATTSAHGAKSAAKTDWLPLTGRKVVIVPDNDEPGYAYAREVAARLLSLTPPAKVRILELPGLAKGEDFEQYREILPEIWKPADVASHLLALAQVTLPAKRSETEAERHKFKYPTTARAAVKPPAPIVLPAPSLVVTRLADVEPEVVQWLWPGRIALGKVTILSGDPGLGKSFLTLDLARRLSLGLAWPGPDRELAPIGSTLLLSAEDSLADTIRPRLDAMGADVKRIYAIETACRGDGTHMPFSLRDHLPLLENQLERLPDCRLIVIDPVSAYLGDTDDHKNSQIRSLLAPLAELASRHGVAVVLVSHLNKSSGGKALYRSMGSLAFVAACRAGFVVVRDRDDPSVRLFLPIKNNLGAEAPGLAYTLESGHLRWRDGVVTLTADQAIAADFDSSAPEQPTKVEECVEWLKAYLAGGAMRSELVFERAQTAGFSRRTVERAKGPAEVVIRRVGGGSGSFNTWEIPDITLF